jgi:hypothetical protein
MKASILYFGIPRASKTCIPSIHSKCISPLSASNFKIELHELYHLYYQKSINNDRSKETGILDPENYRYFHNITGVQEDPVEALKLTPFEELSKFGDEYGDHTVSLRNLVLQLRSLSLVTKMFLASDSQTAIFIRPDLEYIDALPANAVVAASKDSRLCYVPDWQWWGGINDRFAICGRDAAAVYGSRIDIALKFCMLRRGPLHAEGLIRYLVKSHSLKLRVLANRAYRVRLGEQRWGESFDSFGTVGGLRHFPRLLKAKLLSAHH